MTVSPLLLLWSSNALSHGPKEEVMFRGSYLFTLVLVLLYIGIATVQDAPAEGKKAEKAAKAIKTIRPPPVPPPAITLEPKAIEILKAACSRLAAAKAMAFTVVLSY